MIKTPRIKESIHNISTSRVNKITQLISSIASDKGKFIVNQTSLSKNVILGISNTNETGVDFTNWRFRTKKSSFYAMYYEIWSHFEREEYYLDKLYFHLYRENTESNELEEYILLHCDASEPDDVEHSIYKQSPHFHFHIAEYPIPKAHIALNNGNLADIFVSIDSLHLAFHQAIEMLSNQVLVFFD